MRQNSDNKLIAVLEKNFNYFTFETSWNTKHMERDKQLDMDREDSIQILLNMIKEIKATIDSSASVSLKLNKLQEISRDIQSIISLEEERSFRKKQQMMLGKQGIQQNARNFDNVQEVIREDEEEESEIS